MTIRVLIADDQAIVRTGLGMLINAQADMEVVAYAADGKEACEKASTGFSVLFRRQRQSDPCKH